MKISDITALIKEDKANTKSTQFNSEVGLLFGLIGDPAVQFDPNNPEESIPASKTTPETFTKIKKEAGSYDPAKFGAWAGISGQVADLISSKQPVPTSMSWVGSTNKKQDDSSNPSDVIFNNGPALGISIKAEGGITLGTQKPADFGLDASSTTDVFQQYSSPGTYQAWKQGVMKSVLDTARKMAGREFHTSERYPEAFVRYDPGSDSFFVQGRGKTNSTQEGSEAEILSKYQINAGWMLPFGTFAMVHFQQFRHLSDPVFSSVAKTVIKSVQKAFKDKNKILFAFRIPNKPFYYLTFSDGRKLYYSPGVSADIELRSISHPIFELDDDDGLLSEARQSGESVSQVYRMQLGIKGSDGAATANLRLYYAFGPAWTVNPSFKIMDLRDPQFLGWELLGTISGGAISQGRRNQTPVETEAERLARQERERAEWEDSTKSAIQSASAADVVQSWFDTPNHPILTVFNKIPGPERGDARKFIVDLVKDGMDVDEVVQELSTEFLSESARLIKRLHYLANYK